MSKVNCLICENELLYVNQTKEMECYFCKSVNETRIMCENNHYVCDTCHSNDAFTTIINYCTNTDSKNPIEMALDLMKHPLIKMHGPEHHFLVPAVLSTAYVNKVGNKDKLENLLNEGQKRAKNVLGGFCGFYGACGAGVGCGIYASLIQESGPMNKEEWGLCNLITAKALEKISSYGGPRCCKRDSFTAIETAIDFTKEYMHVELDKSKNLRCNYSSLNKECLKNKCNFYKENVLAVQEI